MSMIKTLDYYKTLDLGSVPDHIKNDTKERIADERWGDVVTAIAIRSEYEMLDAGDLIAFIGKPDSIATQGAAEVWNYHWVGFHGANRYTSCTPFRVLNGRVMGVVQNQK
jgi:hypothetical protein